MSTSSENGGVAKRRPYFIPPFIFFAAMALMFGLDAIASLGQLVPPPWHLAGGLLMLGGLGLILGGAQTFRRAGTPVRIFEPATKLVTHGLYRFSRNPIYLGMAVALAGIAIMLGTLSPWIALPLFVVTVQRCFIVPEEALMEQSFGETYRNYRKAVRRWL